MPEAYADMALQMRTARLTGPELQERRRDVETTQDQVAARMGVVRQRVALIEAAAAPSRAAVRRFLAALAEIEAAR